jgi:RHS repeat-associated protein
MVMPGRKYSAGSLYRYGFNGKENDNEIKGEGNQQDYGMRIYDPRLGKFLSVDPISKKYPYLTPYQFASNTPIAAIDVDGLESGLYQNGAVGVSGTPMSYYFMDKEGRKQWDKAMATGIGLGAAVLVDIFVTKGWITRTLLMSQGFGVLYHNKANSPQQAKERGNEVLEFGKSAAAGLLIGKLLGGGESVVSELGKKVSNRVSFLKSFKGFREDFHPYVDVNEKVFSQTLKKGTILYQYQTAEGKVGNFYVESLSTTPEQIGLLSKDYPKILKVELKEDVNVLVTKHIRNKEYWRDNKTKVEGGGTQLFSTEIKDKATITETKTKNP